MSVQKYTTAKVKSSLNASLGTLGPGQRMAWSTELAQWWPPRAAMDSSIFTRSLGVTLISVLSLSQRSKSSKAKIWRGRTHLSLAFIGCPVMKTYLSPAINIWLLFQKMMKVNGKRLARLQWAILGRYLLCMLYLTRLLPHIRSKRDCSKFGGSVKMAASASGSSSTSTRYCRWVIASSSAAWLF